MSEGLGLKEGKRIRASSLKRKVDSKDEKVFHIEGLS
jgi:hypothetical protein